MRTREQDIDEINKAAYQFRATIRLNVRPHRERQLAVERVDEALLWALRGIDLGLDQRSRTEQT